MYDWKVRMDKTVRHLAEQLGGIRPEAVSVGFLETVRVPVQGNTLALGRLAVIARQGQRIVITPFDSTATGAIVKALNDARLNAYALNPKSVCASVPPMSGEERANMARHVKKLGEEARIAVRAVRQDARKQIAARGRGSQRAVQEATDSAVAEIDRRVAAKLAELEGSRESFA
jgi:ribosome recycling factor